MKLAKTLFWTSMVVAIIYSVGVHWLVEPKPFDWNVLLMVLVINLMVQLAVHIYVNK